MSENAHASPEDLIPLHHVLLKMAVLVCVFAVLFAAVQWYVLDPLRGVVPHTRADRFQTIMDRVCPAGMTRVCVCIGDMTACILICRLSVCRGGVRVWAAGGVMCVVCVFVPSKHERH